jgi:hypothetical protein
MAEEITQEQTAEPVPVAQETSVATSGNTQQVQDVTTEPATESQPEPSNPDQEPQIEEWNGNDVESLPKPLQARARGMLRKFHEVTQQAAGIQKQAQAYQEFVNHPEFQEFIQWKESRLNNPATANQQISNEPLTEDEFLAAQTDPEKFVSVQQRILMQQAQPFVQKLNALEQRLAQYDQEKIHTQAQSKLEAFGKANPKFWEINPVIMKAVLEDVVQKKGGSLEEAFKVAESLEKQYLEKANGQIKKQVEAKKKAVSASPSKSMEPEVIYVSNKQERDRVAFENAKLGKRVDVRLKK